MDDDFDALSEGSILEYGEITRLEAGKEELRDIEAQILWGIVTSGMSLEQQVQAMEALNAQTARLEAANAAKTKELREQIDRKEKERIIRSQMSPQERYENYLFGSTLGFDSPDYLNK